MCFMHTEEKHVQRNVLPCLHGKLSQAHRHSQSIYPASPQTPKIRKSRICKTGYTVTVTEMLIQMDFCVFTWIKSKIPSSLSEESTQNTK